MNYQRQPASETAAVDLGALITLALRQDSDRCAFRFGPEQMTRQQVLTAAQATAGALRQHGIAPGEAIAVHIAHSFELAVGLCAVLLAGGCAVPIDPDVSADRQRAILADINPRILLSGKEQTLDVDLNAINVTVDIAAKPGADFALTALSTDTDLAFIVYTSGTSGGPKGVEISHASYVNRLQHIIAISQWDDADTDLAWTPSSFIGMLDEFFYPLLCGVPSFIAPSTARTDPRVFGEMIADEKITRFRITPSLLNAFLNAGISDRLQGVRAIYCSGEALPADVQTKVQDQLTAALVNFYGATEAPGVAYHVCDVPPSPRPTYTAQDFVQLRIVDEDGAQVAVGAVGEVWISGSAIAHGYRGKPALSDEKFVTVDQVRWYRTGDSAKQLDDGRFELIGRIDLSEVNIHGVRINLPEVRDVLRNLDGVADAWVSFVQSETGRDPVLVAHCVLRDGGAFDPASAKTAIAAFLPPLAVPRHIITHDRLPLTANGKLDVQRLGVLAAEHAHTSGPASQTAAQVGPASPADQLVLKCFQQALDDAPIGLDDNFFEAGGTSLEAVTLVCLVSERFKKEIGFEELWHHPTARALSAHVGDENSGRSARTFFHVEGVSGPTILAIGFGVGHLSGLWPDRKLYVTPGITGDLRVSIGKRLDDYVSEYIEGLRKAQPTGPYAIVGFSFCGLIAYEIARRLEAEGETILGVALVEPVTPMGATSKRSYPMVVAAEFTKALMARDMRRARLFFWLAANTVSRGKLGAKRSLTASYGHLVVAAEQLRPYAGAVDLICNKNFSQASVAKWQSRLGSKLQVCTVEAEKHMDVIKSDSLQQWKRVIDRWTDA